MDIFQEQGFNTVLPPNSPTLWRCAEPCKLEPRYLVCLFVPSGGVVLAMADGGVRFINNNIDVGDDLTKKIEWWETRVSPYGVWGAMGSKAGGEVVRQ